MQHFVISEEKNHPRTRGNTLALHKRRVNEEEEGTKYSEPSLNSPPSHGFSSS